MAKRFFYVCAGLFLLAGAYALGARNAGAQAPGNSVVAIFASTCPEAERTLITANGDIWGKNTICAGPWTHIGNVFSSVPVEISKFSVGKNEKPQGR